MKNMAENLNQTIKFAGSLSCWIAINVWNTLCRTWQGLFVVLRKPDCIAIMDQCSWNRNGV